MQHSQRCVNLTLPAQQSTIIIAQCDDDPPRNTITTGNVQVDIEDKITTEEVPLLDINNDKVSTTSSDSESLPGKHAFDNLLEEADHIRKEQVAKLVEKYGHFVDDEKAFRHDQGEFRIPESIQGVDRIYISSHMKKLLCKENQALQAVRLYRDKCTELRNHCRDVETEKEAVRFFWRNQVIESRTRASSI